MPESLLAADFGGIVAAIIGLISIGAAVVNAMNDKKQPPRRTRPKDNTKVRREIEEFLEQQGGRKPPRREEVMIDDIEVVEEPRPRPAPKPVPKPKKAQVPQRPKPAAQKPVASPPRTDSPGTNRPGDRPVGTQNLGTALREHVSQAMQERVAAQAERDLPHLTSRVDEEVKQDLGTFSVSGKKAAPASSTAMPLVKMLRNPQSARNAVIIAEVLGRPKALRK